MKTYDVLNRTQSVHCHSMLEASAGTGKTYAIENIVVRLLIERRPGSGGDKLLSEDPFSIEQILIVTFTRAGTFELKRRIRKKLENDLKVLKGFLKNKTLETYSHDYLIACMEKGEAAVSDAVKRIKKALKSFDQSQIFTIHSFCSRMLHLYALDANLGLHALPKENNAFNPKVMKAVRDFLFRELKLPIYSPSQLKILASHTKHEEETLIVSLIKEIDKGVPIEPSRSFLDLFHDFQEAMAFLKAKYLFDQINLKDVLLKVAQKYKVHDAEKKIKAQYVKQIDSISDLFQKNIWTVEDFDLLISEGLITNDAFKQENLRTKQLSEKPAECEIISAIREVLEPIVNQAKSPSLIFAKVASDCQLFLAKFQEHKEILGAFGLLKKMREALNNPSFKDKVQAAYKAVIVDEFQDTDPLQWEIFSNLFSESKNSKTWKGYLNLVGDPKQSIYAFRQADIYTYLNAAKMLGEEALATLAINYRSHPRLVIALNTLFKRVKNLFWLPKISSELPFWETNVPQELFTEECSRPLLEFWLVKTEMKRPLKDIECDYILPAIVQEIIDRHEKEKKPLSDHAILVADRYQATRVASYLKDRGIAVKLHRGKDLITSPAFFAMRELIQGILNYKSQSSLRILLASRLIGMTNKQLSCLEDEEKLNTVFNRSEQLRHILMTEGFAVFFQSFMKSCWHGDEQSVLEHLLVTDGNYEFYREWQDLSDFLIEEEQANRLKPYELLTFLDNLKSLENRDAERLQSYIDASKEGVSVLTMHVSKGLEFDTVFALGLINRTKATNERLTLTHRNGAHVLSASLLPKDYLAHCEETDAEKMRQLYVTLTRAKSKLFVPFVVCPIHAALPFGTAAPIELLAAKFKTHHSYPDLYAAIATLDSSSLDEFVCDHGELVALKTLRSQVAGSGMRLERNLNRLIPPTPILIHREPQRVQSYASFVSSLSSKEDINRIEGNPPHDFSIENKTPHSLPSGNEIGILLHEIFEFLAYPKAHLYANAADFTKEIMPYISDSKFHAWGIVIAEMIFNALKTNLPGCHFCLSDVHPDKCFRETEFLFPYTKDLDLKIDAAYLKGVIDLFLEHEGKYYLVDWKSNWLGDTKDAYAVPKLAQAMEHHKYLLQSSIYTHAIKRYLKLFNKRPEDFGGIYYIFLRGVGEQSGIFHIA